MAMGRYERPRRQPRMDKDGPGAAHAATKVAQTFQSAVSQVCNLRAPRILQRVAFADPRPIGNRRYGRLESLRYVSAPNASPKNLRKTDRRAWASFRLRPFSALLGYP